MIPESLHKFGYGTVGTSFTPVNQLGALNWLQAASAVRVKAGGNAADDAAGAGARSVWVEGLDENMLFAKEEIATAGASASAATTTTFFRIHRAYVGACGAYGGGNTGVIDIETTGGTALIRLAAGEGQSQFGAFSVPADESFRIRNLYVSVAASKTAELRVFARENADVVAAPFSPARLKMYLVGLPAGVSCIEMPDPMSFSGKSDVWVDAKVDAATGSVAVFGELRYSRRDPTV